MKDPKLNSISNDTLLACPVAHSWPQHSHNSHHNNQLDSHISIWQKRSEQGPVNNGFILRIKSQLYLQWRKWHEHHEFEMVRVGQGKGKVETDKLDWPSSSSSSSSGGMLACARRDIKTKMDMEDAATLTTRAGWLAWHMNGQRYESVRIMLIRKSSREIRRWQLIEWVSRGLTGERKCRVCLWEDETMDWCWCLYQREKKKTSISVCTTFIELTVSSLSSTFPWYMILTCTVIMLSYDYDTSKGARHTGPVFTNRSILRSRSIGTKQHTLELPDHTIR